jgi:hypothetical protein
VEGRAGLQPGRHTRHVAPPPAVTQQQQQQHNTSVLGGCSCVRAGVRACVWWLCTTTLAALYHQRSGVQLCCCAPGAVHVCGSLAARRLFLVCSSHQPLPAPHRKAMLSEHSILCISYRACLTHVTGTRSSQLGGLLIQTFACVTVCYRAGCAHSAAASRGNTLPLLGGCGCGLPTTRPRERWGAVHTHASRSAALSALAPHSPHFLALLFSRFLSASICARRMRP